MSVDRCVVVGDVVGSRRVEDRAGLREVLADGVERANELLGDALVAPFATLKGVDELGGVLEDLAGSYRAIRTLVEAIHPTEIRFAVVWGEIDVGVDATDVASQDGPAFHRADALLEEIADEDRYVAFEAPGGPASLATTVGNQMELLCMWKAEWTERQAELVRHYREAGSMTAVAERLDVTVQTVSKTLGRARAERILAIEADLEAAMADLAAEVAG